MSEPRDIDFTPTPQGSIAAKRSERYEWRAIFGELIDNAFDAGATTVSIEIDSKSIQIVDNGEGCADFEAMLTMGRHTRQATTQLGRWGVGFEDAAWWVGGPTRIRSSHKGTTRTLSVDWDALSRWTLPAPMESPSDGERGTKILFSKVPRRIPDGKAYAELIEDIGYIYSPALKHGRQIGFRRGRSAPVLATKYSLPLLEDVVDTSIVVEGKRVRVPAGIVPEGVPNPRPGLNYTHGFRVIIPATALGCGGNGSGRIAGWVSLDEGWKLTRNKDDISVHKEDLGAAVFGAIAGIVEKASQQAMVIKSASLAANLTCAFRGLAGDLVKEKRESPSNKSGTVEPGDTGRKRTKLDKVQAGEATRRAQMGRFRIDFRDCKDGAIGEVDRDGATIWLASNHRSIAEARDTSNELALLYLAVMLFAERECDTDQSLLSFVRDGSVSQHVQFVAGRLLAERSDKQPTRLAVVK